MRSKAARSQRCRAGVLWTLVGIVLGQWAIGSWIDIGLPEVRDPEFAHRASLLAASIRKADRPVVIALGSSRTHNGFDAVAAEEVLDRPALLFNFGIPTSGPYLERIWLERLLAVGHVPDLLLIEVIPAHYNARQSPPDLRGLDGARLSAGEVVRMPKTLQSVLGPCRRWLVGRAVPAFKHQAELRERLGIDDANPRLPAHRDSALIDEKGFQPRTFPPEQAAVLKKLAHVQYDICYRDFEISPTQVRQLEETLKLCKAKGIRVALLLTPEGSEFRDLASPRMEQEIHDMLDTMRQRHGVAVVDAREWIDDGEFFDMHHLTPWGARLFSERLSREAIGPMLKVKVDESERR